MGEGWVLVVAGGMRATGEATAVVAEGMGVG